MVSPIARRAAVGWLLTAGTSLRRACRVTGLSTATWRYQRRPNAINTTVLARLQAHGLFTTGLLLERTETPTRRQTLADQTDASPADVAEWRDEALLLNLAFFGPTEHELLAQIGITGVAALAATSWEAFESAVLRAAADLGYAAPDRLAVRSWWEQGQVLVEA